MVTTNQLQVSASNRPSTGCTFNEKELGTVQPDDGLLEAEICSYWPLPSPALYIYIYIYELWFDFKHLLYNSVI